MTILNIAALTALLGGILGLAVLVIAIRAVGHAFRGNIAGVLTAIVIVMLAAALFGVAQANELGALGAAVAKLIFKGL